ncbi:MAG: efflux RND transporter permease subunit [Acidobacteriia bacterium]|nr:efflux RND transporter permease subunit [Terriglobia bacterium]
MLNKLISFSLDNRWTTISALALFLAGSGYIAYQIPIDAFPDLTNNQVVVITECPGLPPTEVEQLVTYPIESAVIGVPKTEVVRSISKLGLSVVTLVLDDSVPTYFARQLVNERLQEVRSRIPAGLEPSLGPVATAFGEIYQYTLEGEGQSLMDRKTTQDWQVRNLLRTIPGINEVNGWGGFSKQYTIEVEPTALQRYNLTLRDVFSRLEENNRNFGGGFIEHAEQQYTIRGMGRAQGIGDLESVVLSAHNGIPVRVRDVAKVGIGNVPRQGAVLRNGEGETVGGMAIMLKGENGLHVLDRLKQRIARMKLPDGVTIVPFYDQSIVINNTINTVARNLLEAGVLVMIVLVLFLGNIRAALIVAAVIPLSMMFGFVGMAAMGITANLMSLGAIDFGMVVDGAVVMMENSVRRLAHGGTSHGAGKQSAKDIIRMAAQEVARPIVFAVAIIIAVYLPIMTLEGLEGRMFRPMAITVVSLLIGSLLLALTIVPLLATFALRGRVEEKEEGWFVRLRESYRRGLDRAFRLRPLILIAAVGAVVVAIGSLSWIGTEFMPRLDEGSLLITTRKIPGISATDSIKVSQALEKAVREFPEVRSVVTKLGRPDLATESMGVYEADMYIDLKPREEWTTATSREALVEKFSVRLEKIPGVSYNFTQPMAMRLDEVVSGIKADVAIKIFGEDTATLERLGEEARRLLAAIPGAADVQAEILSGVTELRIAPDRVALARYGLNVSDVQEMVEAGTGGQRVSEMVEGQKRFPIAVRLPEYYRTDLDAMGALILQAAGGERVRLNQVAALTVGPGPEIISRESGQRRIVVQANVRGRDLGSFVAAAQKSINENVKLPAGYEVDWGGQFENQERAMKRLIIVLPVSILVILGLLIATFGRVGQAFLILLNVPFALVGGIGALWLRGLNLNVSASIGFIALFGVAVLNGIVMVSYINRLREQGVGMHLAVLDGAALRLRPVLMTALVASLGFVPMAVSQATGAEVQRPLATVVIGGLITSTLLTLYVLPLLFPWFTKSAEQPLD